MLDDVDAELLEFLELLESPEQYAQAADHSSALLVAACSCTSAQERTQGSPQSTRRQAVSCLQLVLPWPRERGSKVRPDAGP